MSINFTVRRDVFLDIFEFRGILKQRNRKLQIREDRLNLHTLNETRSYKRISLRYDNRNFQTFVPGYSV